MPKVFRTGQIYSFASSQFLIIYPDKTFSTLWSPTWHELSKEEEFAKAEEMAVKMVKDSNERLSIEDKEFIELKKYILNYMTKDNFAYQCYGELVNIGINMEA